MSNAISTFQINDALTTDPTLVLGTCQIDQSFGEVLSASLKRGAEGKKVVKNCRGGTRAVTLTGLNTTLNVKTVFDINDPLPQIGYVFTVPWLGIKGIILDISFDWTVDEERGMTMDVGAWDGVNTNVPMQYLTDTNTYEPLPQPGVND